MLEHQDRSIWVRRDIQEGLALIEKALHLRQAGPYQIQAAISAVHAEANKAEGTDWPQIATLYSELRKHIDSSIIQLNQAVAVSLAFNPEDGLILLEPLAEELQDYAPFHLDRADMLHRTKQNGLARDAYKAALELTQKQVEREFIQGRIEYLGDNLS